MKHGSEIEPDQINAIAATSVMPIKVCTSCGAGYPLNMRHIYFHKDGAADDSYHSMCKSCRKANASKRSKEKIGAAAMASRAARDMIFHATHNATKRQAASITDLSDALSDVFGGVEGYAKILRQEFNDTPKGAAARTKILSLVTTVISKASEINKDRTNLDDLKDDELDAMLVRFMQEKAARIAAPETHGAVADGRKFDEEMDDEMDGEVDSDDYLDEDDE